MRTRRSNPLRVSRLRPLVACLAIAFSGEIFAGSGTDISTGAPNLPAPALQSTIEQVRTLTMLQAAFGKPAHASDQPTQTLSVKNCNDAGQDSLREAVSLAVDGAAIEFDLAAMACSTISLKTGQITISVANLKIGGPDAGIVTIDGGYSFGYANRIFNHTGQGTLHLDHLELTDAMYAPAANQYATGGCVRSNGIAYLTATNVNSCHAAATGGAQATGGGIWARGLELVDSVVSNCAATSESAAAGGGIFVEHRDFQPITARSVTMPLSRTRPIQLVSAVERLCTQQRHSNVRLCPEIRPSSAAD